jgi:hypothetical protein
MMLFMNRKKQMQKAFGVDEFGHFNFPIKISNVRLARLMYGNKSGCSYCFPHGYETVNSTVANRQRNWKRFRKIKWKDKLSYKKPQHLGLFICIGGTQSKLLRRLTHLSLEYFCKVTRGTEVLKCYLNGEAK